MFDVHYDTNDAPAGPCSDVVIDDPTEYAVIA